MTTDRALELLEKYLKAGIKLKLVVSCPGDGKSASVNIEYLEAEDLEKLSSQPK